jgi:chromosome segregation ATPase
LDCAGRAKKHESRGRFISSGRMDAELKELEETTRGLQLDLERMIASEEQAKTRREHLDTQTNALRKELAAARSRLDRAEQIRNTCKRLTYLEDKLHPLAKAIKSGTSIFVFSLLV